MANDVINEVTLHGVPLSTIAPFVLDSDGKIDFSILLPLPLQFWPGNCSSRHKAVFPGTWLEAAQAIWGAKWNAYQDGQSAIDRNGSSVLTFQTAWSPPHGWIVALFNKFECDISAKWLDEGDADAFEGVYKRSGSYGPFWEKQTLNSPEHKRLHNMLWGLETFEVENHAAN